MERSDEISLWGLMHENRIEGPCKLKYYEKYGELISIYKFTVDEYELEVVFQINSIFEISINNDRIAEHEIFNMTLYELGRHIFFYGIDELKLISITKQIYYLDGEVLIKILKTIGKYQDKQETI